MCFSNAKKEVISKIKTMAWDLILWLIFFLINLALLASTLYQILCLSDLEADYINPFELSSRINAVILPEFILQGVYSVLFLLTGHWFMFLVTLPINYYNLMLYINRKHLIDVTEVFRILSGEKKIRTIKFAFYLILFCLVMVRSCLGLSLAGSTCLVGVDCGTVSLTKTVVILSVFNSLADEDDAVHIF